MYKLDVYKLIGTIPPALGAFPGAPALTRSRRTSLLPNVPISALVISIMSQLKACTGSTVAGHPRSRDMGHSRKAAVEEHLLVVDRRPQVRRS